MKARDHLRALEHSTFGADVARVGGHIERGHGSRLAILDEATKAKFSALDRLIDAEDRLKLAEEELASASSRHASAQAGFDAAEVAAIAAGAVSTMNAGAAA